MLARAFLVIFALSCANQGFWLTTIPERHIVPLKPTRETERSRGARN